MSLLRRSSQRYMSGKSPLVGTSHSKKFLDPPAPHSRMRVRDRSHIENRQPAVVSPSTSRGDTNMRKFILIAGFVLASAAAQAGDRSLSLGGGETKYAPAPARATDASKSAEAAEAPKYVERPAAVEPKAEIKPESKAETTNTETSRTETARPRASRAARMQRYAQSARMSAGPGRPIGPEKLRYVEGRGSGRPACATASGRASSPHCTGTASTGNC